MNNMEMLKGFIQSGGNPQKFVENAMGNNPIISNLIKMAKQGNNVGVEEFARNMFKEKGRDFDKEFQQFRQNFK